MGLAWVTLFVRGLLQETKLSVCGDKILEGWAAEWGLDLASILAVIVGGFIAAF